MVIELVTRTDCHLCDEALAALREGGIEPVLVDVDAEGELLHLYDFRVPVLLVDGQVVLEGKISAESVANLVAERG